jgi:hypothetical protein
MSTTPATVTVIQRCGHQNVYNLATTPSLLRSGVAIRLGESDCLSCRRIEYAKRDTGEIDSSSSLGEVAVGRGFSQSDAWERQEELPELEGTEWAIAAGSRVRFTVMSEAHDWCSDREWTDEEFTQRLVIPARERLDGAWWIMHCDCAPWDLEELLTRVVDASELDGDIRGAR